MLRPVAFFTFLAFLAAAFTSLVVLPGANRALKEHLFNMVKSRAMVGVDPVEAEEISRLSESMIQGDLNSVLGGKRIVMGQALADKLKVRYGDTVQASFPRCHYHKPGDLGHLRHGLRSCG